MATQINLLADFLDCGGWGRHARSFAAALQRHTAVALCHSNPAVKWDHQGDTDTVLTWDEPPDKEAPGIALGPLELLPGLVGTPRIAYAVWETSKVPQPFMQKLEKADLIWVPSQWGLELFQRAGVHPQRLAVVPEGVDSTLFTPAPEPVAEPVARQNNMFRFLCIGKWEVRKGIADLIQAFCREFKPSEPVELVMNCHNPYIPGFNIHHAISEQLNRTDAVPHPRITGSGPLPLPGLIKLMQRCHAFVLPTRAEGWGLPILEAMACGLPCIVTSYSGHCTFVNQQNAYPVAVREMCPVYDPVHFNPGYDWGVWAQPDIQHLRHLMRHVYENPAETADKGHRARLDAQRLWSWDNAAKIALEHLRKLPDKAAG